MRPLRTARAGFGVILLLASVHPTNEQNLFQGLSGLGRQLGLDLSPLNQFGQQMMGQQQQQRAPSPQRASPQMQQMQQNPMGGLGQMLGGMNLGQLAQGLTETINGIAASFFAPRPASETGIPPHVLRRVMRFCTRRPEHPRCRGHPEWVIRNGRLPPPAQAGGMDLSNLQEAFPSLLGNFHLPPVPAMALQNVLANVPDMLKAFVPAPILGQITAFAKQALMSTCARTNCRSQRPEALNQRATIAEHEAVVHKVLSPHKAIDQIDHDVELRLARTHQVKKALLKKAGLDNTVEPENDGVFQKDILLTENQANRMINEINSNQVAPGPPGAGARGRRHKRNALYLEENAAQTWPVGRPIPYMFDQSLTEVDKGAVHEAIRQIQASVPCLKFQFVTSKPATSHLYYVKIASPTFCGLSYIGRIEPANPIYLSFMCGNPMGVAIHETLHALGLNHEQLRWDRDQFIKINWENVNPQNYDFFAIADAKLYTSYGMTYDYGSIMHYNQFIASQNPGKPSMSALQNPAANNPLMGQRNGLRPHDIQMLKKMYCNPGCTDANIYCGAWANQKFCTQNAWVQQNCRRSCNTCAGK